MFAGERGEGEDHETDSLGFGDRFSNDEVVRSGHENSPSNLQVRSHYYVDVPNSHESDYATCEQHVGIDPSFREEVERENNRDINQFLCLPEMIPAKKRKRQQPLLDYTHSRILTSEDYMKGLEDLLAKKEEVAAAAKKKKDEKEATKEQRKLAKEQAQKNKEERAAERARKKEEKARQQREKVPGRRGRAAEGDNMLPPQAPMEVDGWGPGGSSGGETNQGTPQADQVGQQAGSRFRAGEFESSPWTFAGSSQGLPVSPAGAFRTPRASSQIPRSEQESLGFEGTATEFEAPPRNGAAPLQTVSQRWVRPGATRPSTSTPRVAHHDPPTSNLNYLHVIQGMQSGFYNPHHTAPYQPHSHPSTSSGPWGGPIQSHPQR